jgi:hypothetical protein
MQRRNFNDCLEEGSIRSLGETANLLWLLNVHNWPHTDKNNIQYAGVMSEEIYSIKTVQMEKLLPGGTEGISLYFPALA